MDRYFSGFNSLERLEKELILEGKYCTRLSNIFAHPEFKRTEGSPENLGRVNKARKRMAPLENTGTGFLVPIFWN